MLEQDWVGRRVVARRVLPASVGGVPGSWSSGTGPRDGGPGILGDVVGDLVELTPERARLVTRSGEVTVELATITRARLVEPSTADILALERTSASGWVAAEVEDAHGWRLRADHGFSARANSVLALTAPRPDLDTALARAACWYAERGLPLRIHLPLPARHLLDAELERRGWPVLTQVHVLVGRLDVLLRAHPAIGSVEIAPAPDAAWLGAYHHPTAVTVADGVVRALLTRHDRVAFASIRVDGQLRAIGRGTVQDGWLGVTAVAVDPERRRQGLATALMAELWRWGQDVHGAERTYLQVESPNHAAIALYRGLGYWTHHDYRYRRPPE